jgi:mycofactocin precursor
MLTDFGMEVSTSTENSIINDAESGVSAAPKPMSLRTREPLREKPEILEEIVIEEVSIDGMCGVY